MSPSASTHASAVIKPLDALLAVLTITLAGLEFAGAPPPAAVVLAAFALGGATFALAAIACSRVRSLSRATLYITWMALEAYVLAAKGHATPVIGELKVAAAIVSLAVGVAIGIIAWMRPRGADDDRYVAINV